MDDDFCTIVGNAKTKFVHAIYSAAVFELRKHLLQLKIDENPKLNVLSLANIDQWFSIAVSPVWSVADLKIVSSIFSEPGDII